MEDELREQLSWVEISSLSRNWHVEAKSMLGSQ